MQVHERIKLLMKHLGLNKNSFSSEIGMSSNVTIGRILNENRTPNKATLLKIVNRFPQVNYDWLLTGQGEMLKTKHSEQLQSHISGNANALQIVGSGGHNKIEQHNNGSKDALILEKQMQIDNLQKEFNERLKEKDDYVERLIKGAFERNKEKDKIIADKDEELKRMREQMAKQQETIEKLLAVISKLTDK
jgi:transcriptional regulator with XRE-family HTH domain